MSLLVKHPLWMAAALLVAIEAHSLGSPEPAATPPQGAESFVGAFRRFLGEKAGGCTATERFLGLEKARYQFEHEIRSRKPPPRDVICFGYSGDIKAFKVDLKAFLASHANEHRVETFGRWHYDEWSYPNKEAQVGSVLQKDRLYGSRYGIDRLEIEVASVPGVVVFEEASGTVAFWFERGGKEDR